MQNESNGQRTQQEALAAAPLDIAEPVAQRESPPSPKGPSARGESRAESSGRTANPSEKELVFDAMRAIRREGHPERAEKLLDEYLRLYPQGSLAEEALALSVEATTMLGESRARSLADRYLSRYPNGRFRASVERARSRFAP
jgi:TolA-binding protein